MNKYMLFMAILSLLTTEQFCSGGERKDNIDSKPKKNRLEKMQEIRDALDMSMSLYGKVIDQDGKPVTDAEVFVYERRSTNDSSYVLKTDRKGFFDIENEKCHLLSIDKIAREGYEYKTSNNPFHAVWANDIRTGKFNPDPANPVIFKMRKKEPSAFVIHKKYHLLFNATIGEKEICLITGRFGKVGELGADSWAKDAHADVRFKVEVSDKHTHVITVTTPDKEAGLIMSDTLLYIVPDDGYQSSLSFVMPSHSKTPKYLYVKGRQGTMYSRLDVGINAKDENTVVNIQSWTNPGGSRNVDYDSKTAMQEIERRNEEKIQKNREIDKKKDRAQKQKPIF